MCQKFEEDDNCGINGGGVAYDRLFRKGQVCFWGYDYKMVNRLRRETLVVFENHGISSLVL